MSATQNQTAISEAPQVGPNALYYEDFEVGKTWLTPARTITEADIVMFAALTGDYNPVHTDAEYAKSTPFGKRILHGPAGFAIATGLEFRLGIKEGTAAAMLGMTWDFRGPILMGDTIKVREIVESKRETKKPTLGIVNFNVAILNQRNEVVQDGIWKIMFLRRSG